MVAPRPLLSPLVAAAVIVLLAALAYANSLAVPFLFDDVDSIRDNPTIRQLGTAWSPPKTGGTTVSGRPFLNFSFALNHAVHGTSVAGYHITNIAIHALAGCVLAWLVAQTLRHAAPAKWECDAPAVALLAAALWVVHPLQTESVTYIAQRAESLVALLYLLTLACVVRSVEPNASRGWAVAAVLCCTLGMATKEVMVTAPVMIALYDRIFLAGSWRETWRRRGVLYAMLAATWLLLAWLVAGTDGRGGTAGLASAVSVLDYSRTQVVAIAQYLRLAAWPSPLVFDYGTAVIADWRALLGPALVVVPLAVASVVLAGRGRWLGYAGLWWFVVLAPSSSFVPVATQTIAEHRVYLPLAGVAVIAAVGLYAALGRAGLALGGAAVLGLAGLTVARNHDYRSAEAIWSDVVAHRPDNARAWGALGAAQLADGRLDDARASLETAVRTDPRSLELRNNLGDLLLRTGRWAEAEDCFRAVLAAAPDEPYASNNLGNALLQLGRPAEAIPQFEAALRVRPDLPDPRFNLANTLAQSGRPTEALPHYVAYLKLKPDDAEARSNYAVTLQMAGRPVDAVAQLEAAVRLRPGDAELHNNLGTALAAIGRVADALPHFQEAVRLRPDFAAARDNAARAAAALQSR